MRDDLDAIRRGAEAPIKATLAMVDDVARDLSAAFVDDPILSWFMAEGPGRDAARLRFFKVLLRENGMIEGEVERPEAGGAAAVWMPSENMGPLPLMRELRALPALLNAAGLARFPRLARLRTAMDTHHPTDRPHDYLFFLGVHPTAQGAGVGSRLIRARTARLDAQGRAAWLETATPRNVPLYQRHGFQITCEYRPDKDGPLIWGMWREPQA